MKTTKIKQWICQTNLCKRVSFRQLTCIMVLFVLISGCGYTTKSLISRKINTIYIPIFENNTFRRGLEFDLTTAVKKEIMSKTKLRIVRKDSADTILTGKIIKVTEGMLSSNVADNIVESRVTIFVDILLVDRRTGRTLVEENSLSTSAEFVVNRGENINSASMESLAGLAETIVNQLEEKW
ncbi:LptE family protein [Candidatus Scalindua japonica]|nr:LptE family protein [Candidatus Scalindua japonica]